MTNFNIHTIETAPERSRDVLAAVNKKYGFIPNLMGELAESPSALKGYLSVGEMLSRSSLSPAEQKIMRLAVIFQNQCSYCMAAHTATAKMNGVNPWRSYEN
ncbi:carboxymuconolactone decarboxylase family protein [bacterium]|nr:carboxymuconolactone decarboxylase family protein [bacterium]